MSNLEAIVTLVMMFLGFAALLWGGWYIDNYHRIKRERHLRNKFTKEQRGPR